MGRDFVKPPRAYPILVGLAKAYCWGSWKFEGFSLKGAGLVRRLGGWKVGVELWFRDLLSGFGVVKNFPR